MKRKYILKPGRHQFAPGSPAVHTNDNTSEEEAKWYLEKYPHIAVLFEAGPEVSKPESVDENCHSKKATINKSQSVKSFPIIGEIKN